MRDDALNPEQIKHGLTPQSLAKGAPAGSTLLRSDAAEIGTSQSARILIVEDSPVEAEILRRSLVRAGFLVIMAKDGAEGLQLARARHPDMVVSDINMPVMSGYDLCHAIKYDEALWNVPVILLTVLSEAEDIMQAINSGADGYIIKPFDEFTLLERIQALLATPIFRKRADERRQEMVEYNGKPYAISGGSQQLLNLLLSVFENTLAQNRDLTRIQIQLNLLNENLDEQVKERTADLLRLNRALRTLSACDVALVQCISEEELLQNICRNIVEIGEHLLVCVSFVSAKEKNIPRSTVHHGDETVFQRVRELEQTTEYTSHCPLVKALDERRVILCRLNDAPECSGLMLTGMGVKAILVLPLQHNGEAYGVLTIFSSQTEVFVADEIRLMEELAGDLAFGINSLRTREERDRAVAGELHAATELRTALEETIAAVALTLEKRDPYAAGHQQRVARLASNIATEMGLTPPQVEGIHFGAQLQNIGTVAIPAEILNRPGKLTQLQFAMIKLHPQTGFEIVKDIPFPWPVAQMVLQHHERLDGSGYPQGLTGEQIMLEARVLAVADVLEAMMAYRPYRAALGMEEALDYLRAGRGTLFDATVVDACLRVFDRPDGHAAVHRGNL